MRYTMLALLLLSPLLALEAASGFAPTNGIQTYYEDIGQGEPVVFIHGFSLDHRMWQGQMEFAKQYRVVRYDVRGHGRSVAEPPWTAGDQVADLLALLDHLKIQRAHLVGLSMGGGIAVNFALAHPERVKSLVLVAPGIEGFFFSPESIHRWFALLEICRAQGAETCREKMLDDPVFDGVRRQPEVFAEIKNILEDFPTKTLTNPYTPPAPPTPLERLPEIHAPTLVMMGALDQADLRAIADIAAQRIPGARKKVFENAGHLLNLEQPAEFNTALEAFLKEVAK